MTTLTFIYNYLHHFLLVTKQTSTHHHLLSPFLIATLSLIAPTTASALTEKQLNTYMYKVIGNYRTPGGINFDDSYGANPDWEKQKPKILTPARLMQRIQRLPEKTIEATLLSLRGSHSHLFVNYVLMYRSRSLQDASFLFPRALLVEQDARFVLTYNGYHRQKGYDRLELMHFDPQTLKFNFHEIIFSNNEAQLSAANPRKCLRCHQSSQRQNTDPRPNWEPYNVWPGAYNSIGLGTPVTQSYSRRFSPELNALDEKEGERYAQFAELQLNHPRYRYLRPQQVPLLVFGPDIPALTQYLDQFPHAYPEKPIAKTQSSPITRFTLAIATLNYLRVARLIEESPLFPYYRETLIAGLTCNTIFMPEPLYQWHLKNYLRGKEFIFATPKISAQDYYNGQPFRGYPTLLSLIFEPHGIQTDDWSTDFGTGGAFAVKHRFSSPGYPKEDFIKALKAVWDNPEDFDKPCKELAKTSYEKLDQFWYALAPHLPTQTHPSPDKLMRRCLECHGSEHFTYGAPYLPFFATPRLNAKDLHKTGYPRGTLYDEILYRIGPDALFKERMPADGYIPSSTEMNVFRDYLEELFNKTK